MYVWPLDVPAKLLQPITSFFYAGTLVSVGALPCKAKEEVHFRQVGCLGLEMALTGRNERRTGPDNVTYVIMPRVSSWLDIGPLGCRRPVWRPCQCQASRWRDRGDVPHLQRLAKNVTTFD